MANNPIDTKIAITGEFTNYMTGKMMGLNEKQVYTVLPWQYFVLVN